MYDEINRELAAAKANASRRDKLRKRIGHAEADFSSEKARHDELASVLMKEEADVTKLEGLSLKALFASLLGDKEERLRKERQEFVAAKLKFDESDELLTTIRMELEDLRQDLRNLGDPDAELRAVLDKKEALIRKSGGTQAARLLEMTEQAAALEATARELEEAVLAGEEALAWLKKVIESIQSAENWGTWDMLGGGWLATMAKHDRLDDAKAAVAKAQRNLDRFRGELDDVGTDTDIKIEIGEFAKFADYFFDGLISDWVVQSKIKKALEQAVSVRRHVESLIGGLRGRLATAKSEMERLESRRRSCIEEIGGGAKGLA